MNGLKRKKIPVDKSVDKCQNDTQKSPINKAFSQKYTMPPTGLEPVTHGLRVHCSTN